MYSKIFKLILTSLLIIALTSCNRKKPCAEEVVVRDCPQVIKDCLTAEEERGLRDGSKTWHEVWAAMKARCPGVDAHDNGATVFALTLYPKAILITSKTDMAARLKDYVKENKCCIKTLRISGHGRSGLVSTGDGQKTANCKHINGTEAAKAQWKEDLKDLKDVLCKKGSTIILQSCSTAAGETGLKKLQEIASEYGVTVIGATETCTARQKVEDLPEDKKRTVTPPVDEPADPGDSEKEELEEQAAARIIDLMEPVERELFEKAINSMVFYPADLEDLPVLNENLQLPIRDSLWIQQFKTSINDSLAFTPEIPYAFESSALVLLKHTDSTYQYMHGLYGNRLIMASDDDGYMRVFEVTDQGRELFELGLESME